MALDELLLDELLLDELLLVDVLEDVLPEGCTEDEPPPPPPPPHPDSNNTKEVAIRVLRQIFVRCIAFSELRRRYLETFA